MVKIIFYDSQRSKAIKGGTVMNESIYESKNILCLDANGDLENVGEAISAVLPLFRINRVPNLSEAQQWLDREICHLIFLSINDHKDYVSFIEAAVHGDRPIPIIATSLSREPDEVSKSLNAHVYLLPDSPEEYIPFLEKILGYEYGWLPLRTLRLADTLFGNMNNAPIHHVKPVVSVVSRWRSLKIRRAYMAT
jgi:hypothetical protein